MTPPLPCRFAHRARLSVSFPICCKFYRITMESSRRFCGYFGFEDRCRRASILYDSVKDYYIGVHYEKINTNHHFITAYDRDRYICTGAGKDIACIQSPGDLCEGSQEDGYFL